MSSIVSYRCLPPKPCTISRGRPCIACSQESEIAQEIFDADGRLHEAAKTFKTILDLYLAVTSNMNEMHSPLILRAPVEIASKIFQFCVSDVGFPRLYHYDRYRRYETATEAACAISAVCRGWRDIAISTPQLWTTIDIAVGSPRLLDHLDTIQAWLSRSKALPLKIELTDSAEENLWYEAESFEIVNFYRNISRIADVLKVHSERWEDLGIYIPSRYLGAFGDIPHVSPVFRSLSLMAMDDIDHDMARFRLTNFRPCKVKLHSVSTDFLGLDWTGVTQADVGSLSVRSYVRVLQRASNLRQCELSSLEFAPGPQGQIAVENIVHPALEDFDFSHPDPTLVQRDPSLQTFFGHISCPALKKFRFGDYVLPVDTISSFFARSSCQLAELRLSSCRLYDRSFQDLLSQLPSLVLLDISSSGDDYSPELLFRSLSRIEKVAGSNGLEATPMCHSFLPNLRTLSYTANPQLPFPWVSFSDVFGPRHAWRNPLYRPLHCLHIFFPATRLDPPVKMDIDVLPTLLALKEVGIDLQVRLAGQDILQAREG
ncbi:hypothetical protein CVT26_009957 [Gymnopilus dilepis]|uniref:Uncharacterized protein n=1 Tax=Gymnopilus dilepis TaxID=231916 RepID=A0A409VL82_9AGAR|nr:hypothetical protein CVT26_009957 [Gymnopilus dilepis]